MQTRTFIKNVGGNIHYIIYKITNQINGKFYIGSHKTKDLNDNYMGSGKYLKHAQKKYGIENFKKEILFVFETAEEMYAKEAEIVNEDFLATENTYNLKVGGLGGFDYINANPEKFLTEKRLNSLMKNSERVERWKRKFESDASFRETIKNNAKKGNAIALERNPNGLFYGKSHSDETKKKISESSSLSQKGEGNSQFGTRWIYSLELKISKKIKKDEVLPEGWLEGRKLKF